MSPSLLESVSWVDVVALVLLVAFGVAGLLKGAIRFIVGLASVVVGIILAGTFGDSLGAASWPLIAGLEDPDRVGVLVGCGVLFGATLIVGGLVARMLRKAAEETDLGGIDRLLGLLFGALRGLLLAELLVTVLMFVLAIMPDSNALRADLEGSYSLEATRLTGELCRQWFPDPMAEWLTDTLELPRPEPADLPHEPVRGPVR